MNDNLVKEIAGQATVWCEHHAKGTPVAWEWEMKFAELIVKECIYQVSLLMEYTNHETVELQGAELKALREARQIVEERFGIKK